MGSTGRAWQMHGFPAFYLCVILVYHGITEMAIRLTNAIFLFIVAADCFEGCKRYDDTGA